MFKRLSFIHHCRQSPFARLSGRSTSIKMSFLFIATLFILVGSINSKEILLESTTLIKLSDTDPNLSKMITFEATDKDDRQIKAIVFYENGKNGILGLGNVVVDRAFEFCGETYCRYPSILYPEGKRGTPVKSSYLDRCELANSGGVPARLNAIFIVHQRRRVNINSIVGEGPLQKSTLPVAMKSSISWKQ